MQSHDKGFPVVAGFLSSFGLLFITIYGFLHKGIIWPMKYPPGDKYLTWPQAALVLLGALCMLGNGTYFLFVLRPGTDAKKTPMFFRLLLWLGMLLVGSACFLPDSALGGGVAVLDNLSKVAR